MLAEQHTATDRSRRTDAQERPRDRKVGTVRHPPQKRLQPAARESLGERPDFVSGAPVVQVPSERATPRGQEEPRPRGRALTSTTGAGRPSLTRRSARRPAPSRPRRGCASRGSCGGLSSAAAASSSSPLCRDRSPLGSIGAAVRFSFVPRCQGCADHRSRSSRPEPASSRMAARPLAHHPGHASHRDAHIGDPAVLQLDDHGQPGTTGLDTTCWTPTAGDLIRELTLDPTRDYQPHRDQPHPETHKTPNP